MPDANQDNRSMSEFAPERPLSHKVSRGGIWASAARVSDKVLRLLRNNCDSAISYLHIEHPTNPIMNPAASYRGIKRRNLTGISGVDTYVAA